MEEGTGLVERLASVLLSSPGSTDSAMLNMFMTAPIDLFTEIMNVAIDKDEQQCRGLLLCLVTAGVQPFPVAFFANLFHLHFEFFHANFYYHQLLLHIQEADAFQVLQSLPDEYRVATFLELACLQADNQDHRLNSVVLEGFIRIIELRREMLKMERVRQTALFFALSVISTQKAVEIFNVLSLTEKDQVMLLLQKVEMDIPFTRELYDAFDTQDSKYWEDTFLKRSRAVAVALSGSDSTTIFNFVLKFLEDADKAKSVNVFFSTLCAHNEALCLECLIINDERLHRQRTLIAQILLQCKTENAAKFMVDFVQQYHNVTLDIEGLKALPNNLAYIESILTMLRPHTIDKFKKYFIFYSCASNGDGAGKNRFIFAIIGNKLRLMGIVSYHKPKNPEEPETWDYIDKTTSYTKVLNSLVIL